MIGCAARRPPDFLAVRVCATASARLETYFEQNDPLPSDGRGNSLIRLLQLLERLDTQTDRGRFSLSHPMGYVFSVAQPSRLRVKRASPPYSHVRRRDAAGTRRRGRLRYSFLAPLPR